MKHNALFAVVIAMLVGTLLSSCSYEVRTVKSRPTVAAPGGLIYALPRTQICVDVTLAHYDTTGAPFVRYASEMLSMAHTLGGYEMRQVQLSTQVVADPQQFYFVRPHGVMVQVDNRNLLRSVGIDPADIAKVANATDGIVETGADASQQLPPQYNLYDRTDTFYTRYDRPERPSLVASKKDTRSQRQQAQAAAERIGQLQERRQQLLNGDYETSYTPEGIKLLLQLIDRQEEQLVEQFVGRYTTETVRLTYTPRDERTLIDSQEVVLFYFSPKMGIMATEMRDAIPVTLSIRCNNEMRNAARFVKYRTGLGSKNINDRNTFKYRQSEQADVTLSSKFFTLQRQLPIAQFGPTIELPKGKIKALFDTHTGDLIYVSN